MSRSSITLVVLLVGAASGCTCSPGPAAPTSCSSTSDCDPGERCEDGVCVSDDGGTGDGGPTLDGGGCASGETACGISSCCGAGEICRFDGCVSDLGPCTTNDECWGDSYCSDGRCVPYGIPPGYDHDEMCERSIDIEALVPEVQCRWSEPPAGDAHPSWFQVMSTPVVVDLDLDDDPATLAPSIVFTTFPTAGSYSQPGVLRIADGATCAEQLSFHDAADQVMSPAGVAAGDLDGDGRADIVAQGHGGGLKAFGLDAGGTFVRRWTSGVCDAAGGRVPDNTGGTDQWGGPSIHDLDGDGVPEIVLGSVVYDANGCVLSSSLGYRPYHKGLVPVLADVDEDGRVEIVHGDGLWEWDPTASDWVAEPYFTGGGARGQVAVADLGDYPLAALGGMDGPEVAVVASGQARVQTLEGTVVFGPVAIPGGGVGGAPTIADFDGDGRREFASAGGSSYVVFDLDCVTGGDPGRCVSGRTDGILWTQPSQDASSNVTGSSVFDFDADGAAEAVYADECFLRIYDGATGTVRYSAARSSGTTYENPVIVDVDGDFHSEIVSAVNDYAGTLGCPGTDPLRPTSAFTTAHGIVVLRDEMDRWAASRPVWSQHAYAVTHVGDRGDIPATGAWTPNWRNPSLNNFRQNVQGELDALGVADLTAASREGPLTVLCEPGMVATLPAQICNRGTLPLAAGTEIAFRVDATDGPELCRAPVPVALTVGECTEVTCTGTLPMNDVDLYVVVDPDGLEPECWEGNNFAVLTDVRCSTVE
jgi:hypothetical protein